MLRSSEMGRWPWVSRYPSSSRSRTDPKRLTAARPLVPEATATLDWRSPPVGSGRQMLFEAFITDQRKTADTRHVEDAHIAIAAFQRGMRDPANFESSVEEPVCLSLLEGMMLKSRHIEGLIPLPCARAGKIVGFAAIDPLRDVVAIQYWPSVSTNCLALSGGATLPLRICSGVTGPP